MDESYPINSSCLESFAQHNALATLLSLMLHSAAHLCSHLVCVFLPCFGWSAQRVRCEETWSRIITISIVAPSAKDRHMRILCSVILQLAVHYVPMSRYHHSEHGIRIRNRLTQILFSQTPISKTASLAEELPKPTLLLPPMIV